VRSPVAKRIIRTLPFLAPLTHWRPALDAGPAWAWLACVVPVLGWHLASRRAITAALRGARFFPPVTGEERAGMVYLQAASGPVQEYLHRGVLLGALAPALGPAAVAATTVTFVAEHVLTSGPKGARRRRDVAVWIAISALFGTTVHLAPEALWAAMVGHFLVNLPNVAQWALVPGERRVTSGAT